MKKGIGICQGTQMHIMLCAASIDLHPYRRHITTLTGSHGNMYMHRCRKRLGHSRRQNDLYTRLHRYAYMHKRIGAHQDHRHSCIHAHMNVHVKRHWAYQAVQTYLHACTYAYPHIHKRIGAHQGCRYTYTHVNTCTHMHTEWGKPDVDILA